MIFNDENETNHYIKTYGTYKSMKNLSDTDITKYFIDSTYKCLPNNIS